MLKILSVQGRSVFIQILGICENVARLNLIYRDVTTDGNVINTPVPLESRNQSIYIVNLPLQGFEEGKRFAIQVMISLYALLPIALNYQMKSVIIYNF